MAQPPDVVAAGCVVWREGREVLLVHRPRYDDWSFPKGKLDRGERPAVAAVREAEEETGLRVALGRPLADQTYPTGRGLKRVHYWAARVVGDDDVSGYEPNDEVDAVQWVPADVAAGALTYTRDRETLAGALGRRKRTQAVVVLRHAEAVKRKAWEDDDRQRPLTRSGRRQAAALPPLLAAYGVQQVVSSSSTRCLETVSPYASGIGVGIEAVDALSEEDASAAAVRDCLDELLDEATPTVVCSHRPVLPHVFAALGLDPVPLEPGAMAVVHRRKGEVRAVELHAAP